MKKRHVFIMIVILLIPIILFNSTVIAKSDLDLNVRQNSISNINPQYVVPSFIKYGVYDGTQQKDKPYVYKTVNRNGHYYSGYLYNKGNYYFEGYLYLVQNPFE